MSDNNYKPVWKKTMEGFPGFGLSFALEAFKDGRTPAMRISGEGSYTLEIGYVDGVFKYMQKKVLGSGDIKEKSKDYILQTENDSFENTDFKMIIE